MIFQKAPGPLINSFSSSNSRSDRKADRGRPRGEEDFGETFLFVKAEAHGLLERGAGELSLSSGAALWVASGWARAGTDALLGKQGVSCVTSPGLGLLLPCPYDTCPRGADFSSEPKFLSL